MAASNGAQENNVSSRWKEWKMLYRNCPFQYYSLLLLYGTLVLLYGHSLLYARYDTLPLFHPNITRVENARSLHAVSTLNAWMEREHAILNYDRRMKQRLLDQKKALEEDKLLESDNLLLQNDGGNVTNSTTQSLTPSLANVTTHSSNNKFRRRGRRRAKRKDDEEEDGVLGPFFAVLALCTLLRTCVLLRRYNYSTSSSSVQQRTTRSTRHYQTLAHRINALRRANGERPISIESLRLVLSNRDFDGNDYDDLWRFRDESLHTIMGATQAEIDRCPLRTLTPVDYEFLSPRRPLGGVVPPSCAICLQNYRVEETIRTIPCFHTFHKDCIDPWLHQKAICPVCKHPTLG